MMALLGALGGARLTSLTVRLRAGPGLAPAVAALSGTPCGASLEELDFDCCELGPAGTVAIVVAGASATPGVRSLRFRERDGTVGGGACGDAGAVALANALAGFARINRLAIEHSGLRSEGAAAVAALLQRPNCTISDLSLAGNRLGAGGTAAVVDAVVARGRRLTKLSLASNDLTCAAVSPIARLLADNSKGLLKSLDLSSNRVRCQGGRTLAAAIDGAGTLRELNLAGNLMKSAGAQAIVDLLGSKWTHPLSPASVFFLPHAGGRFHGPLGSHRHRLVRVRHEMTQRKKKQ